MDPRVTDFASTEALAPLSSRGWTITPDEGALVFEHQDGTRFVVRNSFVQAPGFNREQLLDRIALALVASVGSQVPQKRHETRQAGDLVASGD